MTGERARSVPLRKVRAADASYVIVNDTGRPASDIARLVKSVCSCRQGIGADGLVRIRHHGRGRFDLETYDASGAPAPASVSALTCCAIAISDEYGSRCAQLREGSVICAVKVKADQVELLLEVRDEPSHSCRFGPWRAFQVDLGAAHTVLVRAEPKDGAEIACPAGMLDNLRAHDRSVTVITAMSGRRMRIGGLSPVSVLTRVPTVGAAVAAAAVGRSLGIGTDSGLFVEHAGTIQLVHSSPMRSGVAYHMMNHAWIVAEGDFTVWERVSEVMSSQSHTEQTRHWAGEEQWLPISRAC